MSEQPLTNEQVEELRDAFAALDKNKDGVITAEELGSVMRSLGQAPTNVELQDMIDEFDLDQNGSISFEEFLRMMSTKASHTNAEDELRKAFEVFDKDGSGTIDSDELRQVLRTMGENLTEAEIEELIQQADRDGNGSIDYNEFVSFMMEK